MEVRSVTEGDSLRPSMACSIDSRPCSWHGEVTVISQREQLSFPYVADALRLGGSPDAAGGAVHYFRHPDWLSFYGWRDHRSCDHQGFCGQDALIRAKLSRALPGVKCSIQGSKWMCSRPQRDRRG